MAFKTWSGSAFVAKPLKWWSGSAWVAKPLKRWDGSAWVRADAPAAATLVYGGGTSSTSPSLTSLGAQAGDLLLLAAPTGGGTPSVTNGASLSSSTGGLKWRILSAADIGFNVTCTGGCLIAIYRGPTSIAFRTSISYSSGSSATGAGFTKATNGLGLLGLSRYPFGDNTGMKTTTHFFNTTASMDTGNAGVTSLGFEDYVSPNVYPDNAALGVNFGAAGGATLTGYFFEFLY